MRFSLSVPLLAAAIPLAATVHAEPRRMPLAEAERIAMTSSPALLAAAARAESAYAGAEDGRRYAFPALQVTDAYRHYDSDFGIFFGGNKFLVRNADTNTFTATISQPLMGILRGYHDRKGILAGAAALTAQADADRSAVKHTVDIGYLRLFEARALEDVARASQKELDDEIVVAEAQLKAGVLTNADILRLKVARANARQQEILAHTQAEVARSELLGLLGFALDDRSIDFAEPRDLLSRAETPRPTPHDATERAIAKRPELAKLTLLNEAADRRRRGMFYGMLPDLIGEASYIHEDGQVFVPKNSGFLGLKVQWAWNWGADYYMLKAAESDADAARWDLEAARRKVGVEVSRDLAQAEASRSAVDVARQTIESAEEAYRVTGALVKAGSATTTDLLDAEAALTQARLNLTRAEYEQAMARVALEQAMGE